MIINLFFKFTTLFCYFTHFKNYNNTKKLVHAIKQFIKNSKYF